MFMEMKIPSIIVLVLSTFLLVMGLAQLIDLLNFYRRKSMDRSKSHSHFSSKIEWNFELFSSLQRNLPNVPVLGWFSMKKLTDNGGTGCSSYPELTDLYYRNKYWQIFKFLDKKGDKNQTLDVTFHLYGAYFDNRTLLRGPMIRVISMVHSRDKPVSLPFCHIWYNDSRSPVVAPVTHFEQIGYPFDGWAGEGQETILNAYMLSCPALEAREDRTPVSVSLMQTECQLGVKPSNNLRILNRRREDGAKKGIGVCSKSLSYIQDGSSRIIEWIELLRALGADKIMLSVLSVHPNLMKVFDYYESLGVLEVSLTTLPDTQPNDPVLTNMLMYQAGDPHVQLWRNEPISVNDCFLKNMNMYRYIVNIDTDEVIVPSNKTGPTWVEMMEATENVTKNQSIGTWGFRNSWFLDGLLPEPFEHIPADLHMMQHIFRTEQYCPVGEHTKCFHNTETVLHMHQHFGTGCIAAGLCGLHYVDTEIGQNQHYRKDCYQDPCPLAESVVRDDRVWAHLDSVIANSNRAFQTIDFAK